ncbi:DUF4123 domain-containing protein [Pseudomonas sp. IT-P258]|uniref:DUF4123 domain-containing protein n=1 Tax=Pseudomonas sp. IT-P258 TaxID=3026447 RepID=UPI0039E196BB
MNTPEQWQQEQIQLGRSLYLVLDSVGQLDERNALMEGVELNQFCNLYIGTPAEPMANAGPYLFRLESLSHPAIEALLKTPERHWGWLASAHDGDLDILTTHWRERLVTGERPNQTLYRFHDNRVLGRALAYLQPEQRPDYLGPMYSVCFWQAEQWAITDNPSPDVYPLPRDPAWLKTPTSDAAYAGVQFDNARRYLVSEHSDAMVNLAEQRDIDTWLRAQLDLARAWGWQEPEQLHFLLMHNLQTAEYIQPKSWAPQSNETPTTHFERVYQDVLYWQGDASV